MDIIHISYAGPVRILQAGRKYRFEDHPYCGPVVLGKDDEPLDNQPGELSIFWTHVSAWYSQGKRIKQIGNEAWCIYETEAMAARRRHAESRKMLAKGDV